jgi:hypothetical protein
VRTDGIAPPREPLGRTSLCALYDGTDEQVITSIV